MSYQQATVLSGGLCTWIRSDGIATSALCQRSGLTLHWFKGSDRCAPRCPGCEHDAPDGVWVTTDASRAVQLGARLVGPPTVPTRQAPPSRALEATIRVPVPEGLALRPYQVAAVQYAAGKSGVLIADEMGLGKSCEAITIANHLPHLRRILVVCPATLKDNWKREIETWDIQNGQVVICDTATDVPGEIQERVWCICNADRLISAKKCKKDERIERGQGLWKSLMAWQWDALIIDEAHRFKNLKTGRTPRVLGTRRTRKMAASDGLAQRSSRVIALTGTPIPNRVNELWPLVSVLAPETFKRQGDFLFRYCGARQEEIIKRGGHGETVKVWNFDGASNLPELQEKLRETCMIRRLKMDVLQELPAKTRQILPIASGELDAAADAERQGWLKILPTLGAARVEALLAQALGDTFAYGQALDKLNTELENVNISTIAAERQALALAKLPIVIEHVRGVIEDTSQKVVVMAHHRVVIRALSEAFGQQSVMLSGETPMKDRQSIIEKFQTDPACRVFIGGLHAAGLGITLTAASLMVFVEADPQPGILIQCEDRIHRIGQKMPVLIQYFVVDSSIESLIIACALRKQNIIDQALDGPALAKRPRKLWPKATDAQRATASETLAAWMPLPASMRERVGILVKEIGKRLTKRSLTDGEIWLCLKLARENRRLLPSRIATKL